MGQKDRGEKSVFISYAFSVFFDGIQRCEHASHWEEAAEVLVPPVGTPGHVRGRAVCMRARLRSLSDRTDNSYLIWSSTCCSWPMTARIKKTSPRLIVPSWLKHSHCFLLCWLMINLFTRSLWSMLCVLLLFHLNHRFSNLKDWFLVCTLKAKQVCLLISIDLLLSD